VSSALGAPFANAHGVQAIEANVIYGVATKPAGATD
jgi:hypothetical protein